MDCVPIVFASWVFRGGTKASQITSIRDVWREEEKDMGPQNERIVQRPLVQFSVP